MIAGFADKGEDLSFEWINSKNTLDETFGTPTNEYESFFYNAAIEVLNRGGTCIASKLPYNNKQYQQYNYVEFNTTFVSSYEDMSGLSIDTEWSTVGDIRDAIVSCLDILPEE